MSQSELYLSRKAAASLAARIAAELGPACERCEVAGSVRRGKEIVGDIEFVVIPAFSPSLLPHVPGVSLLDLALVALVDKRKLIPAAKNEGERLRKYYVGSLLDQQGQRFKLEINISDAERWPVELAIKTGSAEFSRKLVTWRKQGGFLPGHWRIGDGWKVHQGADQILFESERQFIEAVCGAWVPPEKR